MMNNKILILGASSFSGNSFEKIARMRYESIFGASRNGRPDQLFDSVENYTVENHFHYDLKSSPDQLVEFLLEKKIKTVINFAAQSMVAQSWENPEDWYEANVLGFSKLIKKLNQNVKLEKFIQFSTPEVYGSTNGWIQETFNFAPSTPYAISRAASDWHLKCMADNFGFPVVFTRAANVFGEHQQIYRIVPKAIICALSGRKLPLQGGGDSLRSFIHIDDVSNALLKIIEQGNVGETYHISTNRLISVKGLVQVIAQQVGVSLDDFVEIAPERPGKDFTYQLDSSKLREELLWKDQITLEQGIQRTIDWVESNLQELLKLPSGYIHKR
jgi:dTDP-glucose 4,6-dehydratase